jgi:farnesyl-diphosphate farnesyltransferase
MPHQHQLSDLLQKTSRTFALTIPLLPEPTRREVSVAYLMFRILDTFEDATRWPPSVRIEAIRAFVQLLADNTRERAEELTTAWLRDPPLEHGGYLELIAQTPRVLAWLDALSEPARDRIAHHITRTADGMIKFIGRTDAAGSLQLDSLQELREYCFIVAGIVGQLLTELYLLDGPQLAPLSHELHARAARFGEGLQLVNILKDVRPDAREGRSYLPRALTLDEVFQLAHADMVAALEYSELLRAGNADRGVVAFNALNARLACATLTVLREQGLGAKLSRDEVAALANEVLQTVQSGHSLMPSAATH